MIEHISRQHFLTSCCTALLHRGTAIVRCVLCSEAVISKPVLVGKIEWSLETHFQ